MPVNGFDVFDGDGHVLEDTDEPRYAVIGT